MKDAPLAYCSFCRTVFECPPLARCDMCGSNQVRALSREDYELGLEAGREIARAEPVLKARGG